MNRDQYLQPLEAREGIKTFLTLSAGDRHIKQIRQ